MYTCISGAKFGSILGKINWAAIYTVVETFFLLLRSQIWNGPEGCCFSVICLIVTRPGGEGCELPPPPPLLPDGLGKAGISECGNRYCVRRSSVKSSLQVFDCEQ